MPSFSSSGNSTRCCSSVSDTRCPAILSKAIVATVCSNILEINVQMFDCINGLEGESIFEGEISYWLLVHHRI
ncbi:hypothetical protein K1719_037480 [Acacia pycnantha]|nr:hypothetical protein K1719_037480 [Acacia pycnantha]